MKNKILIIIMSILFPLNVFAYSDYIIPGGNNIGIEVYNKGIIVVGFYKINNKFNTNELKVGDIITKINDQEVYTVDEMIRYIEKSVNEDSVNITIKRKNEVKNIKFNLVKDEGIYKTGLYVKDSINGIGTLTYIDPETKIYGALGHEIIEGNTLISIEVRNGSIFESLVTSIDRSSVGNAGTKNAKFNSKNIYGDVDKNTLSGIYGNYIKKIDEDKKVKVGKPDEVKLGLAKIRTVLKDDVIEEFDIEITKINKDSNIKNISFKIVDEDLIKKTGGVVQGMSGSPIIQDNKIIGAVTHVIVNNPVTGYGIFITTMLEEGEK